MFLRKWTICLILFGLSSSAMAAPKNKNPRPPAVDVKASMDELLTLLLKLFPYMGNAGKFEDKKNDALIKDYLTRFNLAFEKATHSARLSSDGQKANLKITQKNLEETLRLFKQGKKDFARMRLGATTSMCMNCHGQIPVNMPMNNKDILAKIQKKDFDGPYSYAEFLFLVREYDLALENYKLYIDQILKKKPKVLKGKELINSDRLHKEQQLHAAFKKALIIFSKIMLDPEKGISFLEEHQKNPALTKDLQENMLTWNKDLRLWDKRLKDEIRKQLNDQLTFSREKDLEAFISKYLMPLKTEEGPIPVDQNEVTLLVASGLLSRYVNSGAAQEKIPEVLYWLSVSERHLNENMFYSLADSYLKQCMVEYPKSSGAKKCFKEFEENLTMGNTGSSGTHIPIEDQEELDAFRKIVGLPAAVPTATPLP